MRRPILVLALLLAALGCTPVVAALPLVSYQGFAPAYWGLGSREANVVQLTSDWSEGNWTLRMRSDMFVFSRRSADWARLDQQQAPGRSIAALDDTTIDLTRYVKLAPATYLAGQLTLVAPTSSRDVPWGRRHMDECAKLELTHNWSTWSSWFDLARKFRNNDYAGFRARDGWETSVGLMRSVLRDAYVGASYSYRQSAYQRWYGSSVVDIFCGREVKGRSDFRAYVGLPAGGSRRRLDFGLSFRTAI
jgi:hypothetical protein